MDKDWFIRELRDRTRYTVRENIDRNSLTYVMLEAALIPNIENKNQLIGITVIIFMSTQYVSRRISIVLNGNERPTSSKFLVSHRLRSRCGWNFFTRALERNGTKLKLHQLIIFKVTNTLTYVFFIEKNILLTCPKIFIYYL